MYRCTSTMIHMGKTFYPPNKRIEKLSKKELLDLSFDLINAFKLANTPHETALLIQDLLTVSEIKNLAKRLRIAKLLIQDSSQREIAQELHCSIATVTKVSAWLNRNGEGFKRIIAKLPKRYKMPDKLPPGPIEYYLPQALLALTQYTLAKRQENQLEKFMENAEEKRIADKSLQEAFSQEFGGKNKKIK